MKTLAIVLLTAFLATTGSLPAADITSKVKIEARPRTVDRESERVGVRQKVKLTLSHTTLFTTIENLSFDPLPPSKVDYVIQVKGPAGPLRSQTRTVKGTQEIPAIQGRAKLETTIGDVNLRSANISEREDEITGWHFKFTFENGDTSEAKSDGFK